MLPKSIIALEEHFISKHIQSAKENYNGWPALPKLQGLGEERVKDMDAGAISVQVISHAPTVANAEECRRGNDELAEACKAKSNRYAGFAMLPMLEPDEAAKELERTVKELNFVGALINNHEHGTFYDEQKYWTVFAKAVELDVPIYIHPSFPSPSMAEHYKGNFSNQAALNFSTVAWAWHHEIGHHFFRLFAAGLFDKYPKLKIIIGHDGEMLPFMLDRTFPFSKNWGDYKRDLRTVFQENIWVTTSAMFSLAPLACLLKVSKIDHIMYSVDYPFVTNEAGLAFLKELEQSDLVNDEELEKICYSNAERLLKLKAKS